MPLEVIEGPPGTGKTETLIQRVRGLVGEGYSPSDFSFCTYRREMAKEAKARLAAQVSSEFLNGDYIGTIHGICKRLLGLGPQEIADEKAEAEFAEELKLPYHQGSPEEPEDGEPLQRGAPFLNQVFSLREWLALNMRPLEKWRDCPNLPTTHPITDNNFLKTVAAWEEWKKEKGLADFNDLLTRTLAEHLAPETPILIVDEFQDLSPLKYHLHKLWKDGKEYVIIAGDPFQAITSYMGATPAFFEAERAVADKVTVLGRSYRLSASVRDYSRSILQGVGYTPPEIEATSSPGGVYSVPAYNLAPVLRSLKGIRTFHLVRARYMRARIAEALDAEGILHNLIDYRQLALLSAIKKVRAGAELDREALLTLVEASPSKLLLQQKKDLLEQLKPPEEGAPTPAYPPLSFLFTAEALATMKGPTPFSFMLEGILKPPAKKRLNKVVNASGEVVHQILTIHAAKGGEAEVVLLYDASTRRIEDHARTPEGRKDEARVAYVAASRARRALYIVRGFFPTPYRLRLPEALTIHTPAPEKEAAYG